MLAKKRPNLSLKEFHAFRLVGGAGLRAGDNQADEGQNANHDVYSSNTWTMAGSKAGHQEYQRATRWPIIDWKIDVAVLLDFFFRQTCTR